MKHNRILIKIVCPVIIVLIAIAAIFIFSEGPSWKKFPCRRPGYPESNVLLINGKKYDLPIFKSSDARNTSHNAETVNETVTVEVDKATVDWEIILAKPVVFIWTFPNQQECIKNYSLKRECYGPGRIYDGESSCVLVYNLSLIHISEPTRHHDISRMPSSA